VKIVFLEDMDHNALFVIVLMEERVQKEYLIMELVLVLVVMLVQIADFANLTFGVLPAQLVLV